MCLLFVKLIGFAVVGRGVDLVVWIVENARK